MTAWTTLFLLFLVVMIAMHLRGHGGHGHGGVTDTAARGGGNDQSPPRRDPVEPERLEAADRGSPHRHGAPT